MLRVAKFMSVFLSENPDANGVSGQTSVVNVLTDVIAESEEKAKAIAQNARKNAYEVVEKARWEADEILNIAREEAEKEAGTVRETAREQGHKEGFDKGSQEGFAEGEIAGKNSYSDSIKNLNGLMENLTSERKKLIGDLQPLLVELVGEALKRCLNQEAEKGGLVVQLAQEALSKAQDRVHLKLHLNPGDMSEIEANKKQLQLTVGAGEMELIADGRVEGGAVDVRLNTVVDQVKESLMSEMKN